MIHIWMYVIEEMFAWQRDYCDKRSVSSSCGSADI